MNEYRMLLKAIWTYEQEGHGLFFTETKKIKKDVFVLQIFPDYKAAISVDGEIKIVRTSELKISEEGIK